MSKRMKPTTWTTVKLPKKGERVVAIDARGQKRVMDVVAVKRGRRPAQEKPE